MSAAISCGGSFLATDFQSRISAQRISSSSAILASADCNPPSGTCSLESSGNKTENGSSGFVSPSRNCLDAGSRRSCCGRGFLPESDPKISFAIPFSNSSISTLARCDFPIQSSRSGVVEFQALSRAMILAVWFSPSLGDGDRRTDFILSAFGAADGGDWGCDCRVMDGENQT